MVSTIMALAETLRYELGSRFAVKSMHFRNLQLPRQLILWIINFTITVLVVLLTDIFYWTPGGREILINYSYIVTFTRGQAGIVSVVAYRDPELS